MIAPPIQVKRSRCSPNASQAIRATQISLKKSIGMTTAVSACRSASVTQNCPSPPSTPTAISQPHSCGAGHCQTSSAGPSDSGTMSSPI